MSFIGYENGEIKPSKDVKISIEDDTLGTIRGFQIFTTGRVINGKFLFLDDHIERLMHGADYLHFQMPWDKRRLSSIIKEVIAQNSHQNMVIKVILSAGKAVRGEALPKSPAGLYITTEADIVVQNELIQNGVKLVSFPFQRILPETKLTFYIGTFLAESKRKAYQADYPLFVHPQTGTILEGDTFNLFFVKNNTVYTPPLDGQILPGITRKWMIHVIRNLGHSVIEAPISKESLSDFDSAFLTSSIRGGMPISKIDDISFKIGADTPIHQFRAAFEAHVKALVG